LSAYEVNLRCDLTSTTPRTISVSWSPYPSEVGMYEIDGCVGYSPTIVLSAGVEYTFEQHEQDNWMHAIGFSYVAGGAHAECLKAEDATSAGSCYLHGSDGVMQLLCDTDELQCDDFSGTYYSPGYVSQRGGCCHCDASCDHTKERPQDNGVLCQEINGEYYDADDVTTECPEIETGLSYYRNGSEVGLDGYEPEFFWPIEQWKEQGPYKAVLKFPHNVTFTKAYYFCHIHNGMTAEIEIVGSNFTGTKTILNEDVLGGETEESALLIYESEKAVYQKPIESQAELECGTSSGNRFAVGGSLHASQCSKNQYLCGEVGQPFEQCLIMTDCEMHTNMAIDVPYTNTSRFATFARQMIPHHKNAVAMSKILLKLQGYGEARWEDYPKYLHPEYYQPFGIDLAQDIINQQNMQIQDLRNWLGVYEELTEDTQPPSELCYILYPSPNDSPAAGLVLHSSVGVIVVLVASFIVMAV